MKPRHHRRVLGLGVLLLSAFLLLGGSVLTGLLGIGGPSASAATPPWEPDPGSVGGLTFFNAAGQQITGGNLTDSPIAAYVEGTATARSGDTVATLYGYLPKNGEAPAAWSGDQLGGSTTFPNASAPAPLNTATLPVETGAPGDEDISTLETDFPNTDTSNDGYAGLYQLRLYTNAAHKTQTTTYDSADILISGSTWTVDYPAPTAISTTTTVTTTQSSPQVFGTSVQLNATVSPAAPGTVQFSVGSTDIGGPVTLNNGAASTTTTTLPVGTDTINAVFTPATFANYSGSSGNTSFTVESAAGTPTTTTLTSVIPTSPQQYGTSETLTATVSPSAATGTVQFSANGTAVGSPVAVSSGTAHLVTTALPVGNPDTLTAAFTPTSGNGYAASQTSSATDFVVNPIPTTTNLTGVSPTSPEQYGTSETLTATVTPSAATGTVQFSANGTAVGSPATVSGGTAQLITTALPVGNPDSLTALFTPTSGNGYGGSQTSSATDFVVNPIPTTTTLTGVSPTSPQYAGTSETLTATVAPSAATGTVQFSANGTALGSPVTVSGGTAHLVTTALPVGNPDTLTAAFTPTSGNGYAASQTSSATDFVVNPVTPTSTGLAVSPASPQYVGTSETLTATVAPSAATGTVQFSANGTALGSPVMVSGGTAHLITPTLPAGNPDSLTAVFTPTSGSGYGGSTGTASFTITPLNATSTALVSSSNPSQLNAAVTFTATVSDAVTPTGTVSFNDGGAPIAGCQSVGLVSTAATCTATFSTSGSFTITAAYSGDPLSASSTSSALDQIVGHAGKGYLLVASDGGVFDYGDAGFFGSAGTLPLNKPIVGIASTPDGKGYWLVASDGGVFDYGDAGFFGSAGALPLNKPIVGIASTPDGKGYWLVASDGGVFDYGDAGFFGSAGALPLNKPIVGIASTPDGKGYWLVASDGGVFNYGDAGFFGSAGALPLNKPIVGIASTPDGNGYWLVASDGGVFNYGDAGFYGSAGAIQLNQSIVGIGATPDGNGYWLVASDGGVFNYGDAGFYGSTGSLLLNKPIVGAAAT